MIEVFTMALHQSNIIINILIFVCAFLSAWLRIRKCMAMCRIYSKKNYSGNDHQKYNRVHVRDYLYIEIVIANKEMLL